MTVVFRLFARISLATALLVISATAPAHSNANTPKQLCGPVASSVFYPEVRLRKLHLVRPDLIPYPIYYEIYC